MQWRLDLPRSYQQTLGTLLPPGRVEVADDEAQRIPRAHTAARARTITTILRARLPLEPEARAKVATCDTPAVLRKLSITEGEITIRRELFLSHTKLHLNRSDP